MGKGLLRFVFIHTVPVMIQSQYRATIFFSFNGILHFFSFRFWFHKNNKKNDTVDTVNLTHMGMHWFNYFHFIAELSSAKEKKGVPFVTQLWKQTQPKVDETDAVYDILIPLLIMIGLFVVNGFILMIIWRYRKKRWLLFLFLLIILFFN